MAQRIEPAPRSHLVFGDIEIPDGTDPLRLVEATPRRFTADEYECMGERGILAEDDRVELIEGEIIEMSPIGTFHARCVDATMRFLVERSEGRYVVRVQNPIRIGSHSEPQPDIVLARPRTDEYIRSHPGPQDILLALEISDATLPFDLGIKLPLYCSAGIEEAWIVDLQHRRVERYNEPRGAGYGRVVKAGNGESLESLVLPGLRLPTDVLIGPPKRED